MPRPTTHKPGDTVGDWHIISLATPTKKGNRARFVVQCKEGCRRTRKIRAAQVGEIRCECHRLDYIRKRIGDMFGKLRLDAVLTRRSSEGRALCRCTCTARKKDGEECGTVVTVRYHDMDQGKTTTCGRHCKGPITPKLARITDRLFDNGEWWILPRRAATMARAAGFKMRRWRSDRLPAGTRIRPRPLPASMNRIVKYLAEKDVQDFIETLPAGKSPPAYSERVLVSDAAEKLHRSEVRIREIARGYKLAVGWKAPEGDKFERLTAKDKRGRITKRTYLYGSFFKWLTRYFEKESRCEANGHAEANGAENGDVMERAKPAADAHATWKKWHDEGCGYGKIADRWFRATGEDRSKSAIAKALKRLGKGGQARD